MGFADNVQERANLNVVYEEIFKLTISTKSDQKLRYKLTKGISVGKYFTVTTAFYFGSTRVEVEDSRVT